MSGLTLMCWPLFGDLESLTCLQLWAGWESGDWIVTLRLPENHAPSDRLLAFANGGVAI